MRVFAYLDPGTGRLIMQAVLGGAAGIAILWKSTFTRIRTRMTGNVNPTADRDATRDEPVPPGPQS